MLDQLRTVFSSLEKNEAKYLVIGGIAAVLYGVPRATFDLDILIEPTIINAELILKSFSDAGLGTASLTTPEELIDHEITIFRDRMRIDVQTSTPGILFNEGWINRVKMEYQEQVFWVVSKSDLIASKKASGREIDREDIRLLTLDDTE